MRKRHDLKRQRFHSRRYRIISSKSDFFFCGGESEMLYTAPNYGRKILQYFIFSF